MWQCLLMFTILETESEQLLEYIFNNLLVKTMVNHCMLTYFMKLCLTKFKALYGKKWFYFTFWQMTLISGFIEGSWIPIFVFVFKLFQYEA